MSKILAFNVPATGHVNPTLPVVKELTRRGHQVIYTLTSAYCQKIEAAGAEFRAYGDLVPDDYFERRGLTGTRPADTARHLAQTSLDLLPDLLKRIDAEQPDALLFDSMCPWGWLASQVTGIPGISSMTLLILSPADMFRVVGVIPMLRLGIPMLPYVRQYMQRAAEIRRQYAVKLPGFADFMNLPGTLTLSYTSSMIQPHADRLEPGIRFVGPSIEPRPHDADFPWEALDGRPLIYVSLGTLVNENVTFYRECLTAFRDQDVQVVMSVGHKTELTPLGSIPPNVIVRRFVPQLEILPRARLFITHAGMNSVHEGLFYNVALILVPQQIEQRLVAMRLQALGVGALLRSSTPGADEIARTAEAILKDDRIRQRAAEVGESLRTAGGHLRAADEIERLLASSPRSDK